MNVNAHKVGLVVGGMAVIGHVFWSVLVFLGAAKPLLTWLMGMHFLTTTHTVNPFSFGKALVLVLLAGAVGYVGGLILGTLWNWVKPAASSGSPM